MEAKELLDFLGIEADNLDKFKEQFSGKYLTEKQIHENKDLLGKFTGKTVAKIKQNILKQARDLEIPFTNNEFDEMELEEIVKVLDSRRVEPFTSQVNELKTQIGKSGEEAIKPYQEQISKYERALADEKKAKSEIAAQFDQFKAEADGKIKSTRIDYFKKDLLTSIDYDPLAMKDELKKKGWESHIAENFRFDFDEHDNPVILDKTGSKIKNPKKADEWLSPKDVLVAEADKLGLIKKNPQGGQPAFQRPAGMPPITPPGQPAPAPNAPPPVPGMRSKLAPGMEQYLSK